MRIASITMIGQFPEWIQIHVENLKWALSQDDHIYIVTKKCVIEKFNLTNSSQVTYIPFNKESNDKFINFWQEFPNIVKEYSINPEWFLFMEQDILFFAKPYIPDNIKTINSFLPIGDYHNILKNNQIIHSRVWEGAQLINKKIILEAIEKNINFSFVKKSFNDDVKLSMYSHPDTMDEFSLYCALEQKTNIIHDTKACHLRGPESLYRKYPDIINFSNTDRLKIIQKEMPYIDILISVLCYYLVGNWNDISDIDWNSLKTESKKDINRLFKSCEQWLPKNIYNKLLEVNSKIINNI